MDFSAFDKKVNKEELEAQIKEAKENGGGNEDLPKGRYYGFFEKFELGVTKKDNRPMFKCQFRIKGAYDAEGNPTKKYAKKCVFMNRVVYGTKNDGAMINGLLTWLENLNCDFPIVFESYSQLNELILDIFDDISEVDFDIEYDPDAFNAITVEGESVPF